MTVTFFGHGDIYLNAEELATLDETIEQLIAQGADTFYVGNHGQYDSYVSRSLRKLKERYPHISYAIVLSYLPKDNFYLSDETLYPEGIENGPQRFSIDRRNRWMIDQCDVVVSGVRFTFGNSYKYQEIARRKGKCIINVVENS